MMYKTFTVLLLLFTLIINVFSTTAQDQQPKPGTPEDNACNPGGVLYREQNQDGCPSVWYWKAGWFLARYLSGEISRADFPDEFASALPPPLPAAVVITICHGHDNNDGNGFWKVCVSSNRTGTFFNLILGIDGQSYYTDTLPCLPSYGHGILQTPVVTVQQGLIDINGFNAAEIASLNLTPSMYDCEYAAVP